MKPQLKALEQSKDLPLKKLLEIRNLTYEQGNRVIAMQRAEIEFNKAQAESNALNSQISEWVIREAKEMEIDLKVYYFDTDQLKFTERPKPKET